MYRNFKALFAATRHPRTADKIDRFLEAQGATSQRIALLKGQQTKKYQTKYASLPLSTLEGILAH